MPKYLSLILLAVIFVLSSVVRVYNLDKTPAGFFCDEAAIGFNAYSLLTTGKDEFGKPFPFFFESFGDYRLPVSIYSNIPFVALLGLTEFSVRFTTAFFGTLTVLIIYLLTKKLFKSDSIALFSALFLAISPWHIHFSRFGSEYIYFPFWFCLGLYIFLKGIHNNFKLVVLSFIFFGISLYTYYPALFIVPLFLTFLILLHFKKLISSKNHLIFIVFMFLLILIPFLIGINQGTVLSRWNNVSVFKSQDYSNLILQMINTYINHFSLGFLFTDGDIGYPGHFISRFSIKDLGQLYLFQLPLIILGLFYLIKHRLWQVSGIILSWLLLYPLGSTLTGTDGGGPFAFRSIFGVIPFQILSALGVVFIWDYLLSLNIKNSFFKSALKFFLIYIFIGLIMFSFYNYADKYFNKYPLYSSDFWGWQYGPEQIMDYFLQSQEPYDQMLIVGNFNAPQIFPKFYDPTNNCQDRCQMGNIEDFDPNKKQLFAIGNDRLNEIPSELTFNIQHHIYYPNKEITFSIGELTLKQ